MITAEEILNDPKYRVLNDAELSKVLYGSSVSYGEFEKISLMRDNDNCGHMPTATWLFELYYPNNPIQPKDEGKRLCDRFVEHMKEMDSEVVINAVRESIDKTIDFDIEQFKKQTAEAIAELNEKVFKLEQLLHATPIQEDDRVELADVYIRDKSGKAVAFVGVDKGIVDECDAGKAIVTEFGYHFELIKDGDLTGGDIVVIRKNKGDEN